MSDAFIKKNTKLSIEFDDYLLKHFDLLDKIPDGAYVVITVKGDEKFNDASISMVRGMMTKRDKVVEAHKANRRWSVRPLQHQAA